MPELKTWNIVKFLPLTADRCGDFNNHQFYPCPDEYCDEMHDTCEGEPLVHKPMTYTVQIEAGTESEALSIMRTIDATD